MAPDPVDGTRHRNSNRLQQRGEADITAFPPLLMALDRSAVLLRNCCGVFPVSLDKPVWPAVLRASIPGISSVALRSC